MSVSTHATDITGGATDAPLSSGEVSMSHPAYTELARSTAAQRGIHRVLFGVEHRNFHGSAEDANSSIHVNQAMEMLRALLELHPQAAAIADINGTWVLANRAFGRLFEVSTSLATLPATWSKHFSAPLHCTDADLSNHGSQDRPQLDRWFQRRKSDGTWTRFLAHGALLDYRADGNFLIGWTFFEAGPIPNASFPHAVQDAHQALALRSSLAQTSGRAKTSKQLQESTRRDCRDCVEKSREALKLLMLHTNEQKRDMENRIGENYFLTVAPLIEHLKSLNLPESQACLLETLEFNLKHINSVFRIKVRATTKRLSAREMEICQMIRAGKTSRQIAVALGLKPQTVMVHRKHIRRKLGLRRGGLRLSAFLRTNLDPLY